MSTRVCRDCEHPLHRRPEKALSGETQMVWADQHDVWVCEVTGNEHVQVWRVERESAHEPEPGVWIVVEGNPIDGFVFHGIPAFADDEAATEWAENNVKNDWWIAPLQDVE
jgi:hypothetical protein